MARKARAKVAVRPKPVMFDWEQWHSDLFRLAPADWPAPAKVKLQRNKRGGTYSANFVDPEGRSWRFITRVTWNPQTGECRVADERMTVGFKIRGKA